MTEGWTPDCRMITTGSANEQERKIDEFLAEGKSFEDVPLVLAVSGSHRYSYRGMTIRAWSARGSTRYDTAYRLK